MRLYEKYLNERKAGSRSPKQLADDLESKLMRAINNEIEDWRRETFDPVEGQDYTGQMDEVLAIMAKRMDNFFKGMKRGAQSSLKRMRK